MPATITRNASGITVLPGRERGRRLATPVEAGKHIRTALKNAYPKHRFRAFRDGTSVRVVWANGPSAEQVADVLRVAYDSATDVNFWVSAYLSPEGHGLSSYDELGRPRP